VDGFDGVTIAERDTDMKICNLMAFQFEDRAVIIRMGNRGLNTIEEAWDKYVRIGNCYH
jgi:hypothetical protein